ncbi:protein ANTAGONIST OF LIKE HETEROCHROMATIN PROTEIN 1-like [Andrographis paniculata]|uniref:protein ANTAGONIST OF LIKE HETEROCHROMATIN PROTEIN 1-like n=1 Tax=Andrographis paniculata TaxID=175694 RepID=UPI0021E8BE3A|nr:protein ANTAGONIST OF LIKE HETEROCHROMATIN PROTEIN 1-like [Andrographis paniculata]
MVALTGPGILASCEQISDTCLEKPTVKPHPELSSFVAQKTRERERGKTIIITMRNLQNRPLISVLTSLISQILLFLLLLLPSNPFSLTTPNPNPNSAAALPLLLNHFLSTAAALSFLRRKRRRDPPGNGGAAAKRSRLEAVVPRAPDSFRQFFRMKASTFEWLCGLLEPLLECRDPVESPLDLPAEIRLGIGLFRLATGADYPEITGRFGVSEHDSRFCVKHLCRVLCTNYRFWVGFPGQAELDSVSARIETLAGIPNCCGFIACARFDFDGGDSDRIAAAAVVRRTVAAQIVVDPSSQIASIAAGFHGGKPDSQILKSSSLFADVSESVLLNSPEKIELNGVSIPQYLLGSASYPLLPWLIVPFADPKPDSPEQNFNRLHRSLGVSWAKAVASLRNWGILNGGVRIEYKSAVACIGACSILHNMLITREDYSAFSDRFVDDDEDGGRSFVEESVESTAAGAEVRKALAMAAKRG